MNTETERHMVTGIGTVNDELVRLLDDLFVPVTRDIPHQQLVTLPNLLAAQFRIYNRRPAHIRQGRLPANNLGYHFRNQLGITPQLGVLIWILVKRQDTTTDRVPGRVIAADDQQQQVPQELHRRFMHIAGVLPMRKHRYEVSLGFFIDSFIP